MSLSDAKSVAVKNIVSAATNIPQAIQRKTMVFGVDKLASQLGQK